jgi:hypothetical protein
MVQALTAEISSAIYISSKYAELKSAMSSPIVSQEFLPRPEKLKGGVLVERQISMD